LSDATSTLDAAFADALFTQLASDLSLFLDRPVSFGPPRIELAGHKPSGPGGVHVSFRFVVRTAEGAREGCALVPLPDAISMACYLTLLGEQSAHERRGDGQLDPILKDGMLELLQLLSSALDTALRREGPAAWRARAAGCQGVRADVAPAFALLEGASVWVARAHARVADHPEFEWTWMMADACDPTAG
jgi:hypothetical protein